ncbi:hypothetical protein NEHOM01_0025 [Nematocida homosporus]|uniref:uncharacterized protein n=1 Tax=Nematocida homosporus TaxID=1912981 RepID=UPI00221FD332|nr:uncharacterized protein NEHOM01_0025 [Nematocida homosporus]KAI5184280.1 hypothetical protein NEHOM01_0025 [Nematocida homosporus]
MAGLNTPSMSPPSRLYLAEDDRPPNPLKDILIFEKYLNKRYNKETRRRVLYSAILINTAIAYIYYVTKQVFDTLCELERDRPILLSAFLWRIYMKMLGIVLLLSYIFIRLFRKSSKLTQALTSQLKLLNIYFRNQKINLCRIKTPYNIKKALILFREEEQKRRVHWLKED